MQRSVMKKILGKFEMHFLFLFLLRKKERRKSEFFRFLTSCEAPKPTRKGGNPKFSKEFVKSLRLVDSFFALEKVSKTLTFIKKNYD